MKSKPTVLIHKDGRMRRVADKLENPHYPEFPKGSFPIYGKEAVKQLGRHEYEVIHDAIPKKYHGNRMLHGIFKMVPRNRVNHLIKDTAGDLANLAYEHGMSGLHADVMARHTFHHPDKVSIHAPLWLAKARSKVVTNSPNLPPITSFDYNASLKHLNKEHPSSEFFYASPKEVSKTYDPQKPHSHFSTVLNPMEDVSVYHKHLKGATHVPVLFLGLHALKGKK